jgi:hypothetical protein
MDHFQRVFPYGRLGVLTATEQPPRATGTAMDTSTENLRELNDPEFFAHWAAVRSRLVNTPKGKLGHWEVKRRYDAVAAEYRRRIGRIDGEGDK